MHGWRGEVARRIGGADGHAHGAKNKSPGSLMTPGFSASKMKSSDFVHLHSHTMYSLLDGASRIEDMAQLARDRPLCLSFSLD